MSALVSGAVLGFVHLGAVGLNSDEAVYAAQSASLAGNPHFTSLFPVVRAHPLLFQVLISPLYRSGVPDVPGRYVAAAFGVGMIALMYPLGRVLFNARVGALAAVLLAVMPYRVIVSRQIILDGPMTFFATAALTCLAIAARRRNGRWLLAAGACIGLGALCKEPGIIVLASAFTFLALTNKLWRPIRHPLAGTILALGLVLVYPILTAVAGGGHGGASYLIWQLSRRPNHGFGFYFASVGASMGFVLLGVAGIGLLLFAKRLSWRETLLLSWIAVPLCYFEVWPVKGFSYLMPLAPPVAILAAVAIIRLGTPRRVRAAAAIVVAIGCVVSLAVPAIAGIVTPTTSGIAAAGGTPGGREAGRWVAAHAPAGAQFMTIGPSMANLIQFYGGRRADGLSVSPNPLHRNPSYHAIRNADLALRRGVYQYIVWDIYSARRSRHFASRTLQLVRRFHGVAVDVQRGPHGTPLIVIYEVSP
ncbi:MAG: ArnT family glycosyltransferase [Nocardioidaceae bacterium]